MRANFCLPPMRSIATVCLMSACLTASAAPTHAEIAWEVNRNGSAIAEAVDSFDQDGKTYHISSTWKGRGLLRLAGDVRRASRGTIVASGLRPQEFEDARSGRDTERASFNWISNTLTWQYKGPAQSGPIPANVCDRLTQVYGFVLRAPESGPFQVNVVDGRGIHAYTYKVGGREALKTPAGEFETIRLVKVKDGPEDRATEIWLAVKQHHLPVRVLVVEKDGTRTDQVATRVSLR